MLFDLRNADLERQDFFGLTPAMAAKQYALRAGDRALPLFSSR
jgi:hypothetical protein